MFVSTCSWVNGGRSRQVREVDASTAILSTFFQDPYSSPTTCLNISTTRRACWQQLTGFQCTLSRNCPQLPGKNLRLTNTFCGWTPLLSCSQDHICLHPCLSAALQFLTCAYRFDHQDGEDFGVGTNDHNTYPIDFTFHPGFIANFSVESTCTDPSTCEVGLCSPKVV